MSGSDVAGGNKLRAVVERIENIEEEIKELTEAKKEGYCPGWLDGSGKT